MIQTLLFYLTLFATRVSEERADWYVKIMPEVTYYASYVSCLGINVFLVFFNIIDFFTGADRDPTVVPFMVFTILVQLGVGILFFI